VLGQPLPCSVAGLRADGDEAASGNRLGDPQDRLREVGTEAREVGDAWSPFRSVATWYIWRSLDPLPIAC